MKRKIIESRALTRTIDHFIAERKILKEDIEALKKELINNPKTGNIIPGTGGVRKIRLKSFAKGKRGGFRVCYFDDPGREELFLLKIYGKNEKEDLSAAEKKSLKKFTEIVKRG
jgi:mRNA-degrading endonuclease RelE of RelBE toxin-antitoxin system